MKPKILSFIFDPQTKKFLALRSNPHPEHAPEGWFVVTGGVEEGESNEEAVRREVEEETGLKPSDVMSLNWGSIYNWRGTTCREINFISFASAGEIILNEEHIDHEWLSLKKFVERINWEDDKGILTKVLEKALNKELYFSKLEIKDYSATFK